MSDFLNNPWETDEQKRQKLNNSQTQTPFNGQQTQMTPRQMVEQTWDQSVAKQEAKEQAYKPMESMSTHDAVKYAWDKSVAEHNVQNKDLENSQKQNLNIANLPIPPRKPRYAELNFDGKRLDWVENNQIRKSWPAMSGRNGYQGIEYTAAKNYGPIPEGTWNIRQKNLQNFDDLSLPDQAISYVGGITKYVKIPLGKWPGGTFSWGNYRIPLEAREQTNTMGRTNLFLHGGRTLGSSGCIDIANGMDEFTKDYQEYGADMLLNVHYPYKRW